MSALATAHGPERGLERVEARSLPSASSAASAASRESFSSAAELGPVAEIAEQHVGVGHRQLSTAAP